MALLVHQVAQDFGDPEDQLQSRIAAKLRVPSEEILAYAIVRRSIDARIRHGLRLVYSVEVALRGGRRAEQRCMDQRKSHEITARRDPPQVQTPRGTQPLAERPVVVGFGPAGMFAALVLAREGYRPVVLERGREVRVRHKDVMQRFYRQRDFDPESNLLYGEGGAGTYSDGKLYTRVNHPHVQTVLRAFFEHGANADIMVDARPHIGSDRLPNICMRIRQRIESLGGEIRFGARLEGLLKSDDGALRGLRLADGEQPASCVILGIGHSARDTLRALHQDGVQMEAKPFQLGVRIEHPQDLVNRWSYHQFVGRDGLPPADYRLVAKGVVSGGGDMFSFCMCPGGEILPTNEAPGLISTNGASRAARGGGLANSGLVITVQPERFGGDPLGGLSYQEHWERLAFEATGGDYAVPAQRAADFINDAASDGALTTSYPLGGCWTRVREVIPEDVADSLRRALIVLDNRMAGFAGPHALITAPETRASAPLRIVRDAETRESVSTPGLYPIGEGAGYAGGIISAAIDGIKSAESIMQRYAPF